MRVAERATLVVEVIAAFRHASLRLVKPLAFKHSSRTGPLKLST
jgi:hypothetical protein